VPTALGAQVAAATRVVKAALVEEMVISKVVQTFIQAVMLAAVPMVTEPVMMAVFASFGPV
jgi:hypothetical protein